MVGYNTGGTISNSYATGSAYGGSGVDSVGGLVGYANNKNKYGSVTIGNSYATGSANGGSGVDSVGGLVGYANSKYGSVTIGNSYALGNVDGGLVGIMSVACLAKKGLGLRQLQLPATIIIVRVP